MRLSNWWCQAVVTFAGFMLMLLPAGGQNYPSKLVRIVVPYTAGGGTDTIARPLAQRLSEKWGQSVIIENRGGAGTAIGAEMVARSAPDGYTLLLSDATTYVINPYVYAKLPYNPNKDFTPISIVCRFLPGVVVNADVPAKTLGELIALAKQQPGKLTYGSFGNGTYAHVAMEDIKRRAGIDMPHVPYRGGAQVVTDLLSGQLTASIATISNFWEHEKAGKLRVIAAATEKRLSLRPDLPTVGETLPGYAIDVFVAVAAPAGTPPEILNKVSADIAEIVKDPVYRDKYLISGFLEPVGSTREEFAAVLARDNVRWRELVARTGVRIE